MYGGSTGESKQDLTAGAGDVAIAVEGEGVLRASLLGLSADLTAEVLSFLSGSEVGGLARVCRSLKDTTDDGRIWRGVYWREFDSGFGSKLSLRVRNPKKVRPLCRRLTRAPMPTTCCQASLRVYIESKHRVRRV